MVLHSLTAAAVRTESHSKLINLLDTIPPHFDLFIQQDLVTSLNLIVTSADLHKHGAENVFYLDNKTVKPAAGNVVFLARSNVLADVYAVADRVASLTTTSSNPPTIHIIWVPKSTLVTHHVLEQAGVLADPLTYDLPLYFMPLADDVLSLEDYTAFQDLYKDGDVTCIHTMAVALMNLQTEFGLFPRITGQGRHATQLYDLLSRMRKEKAATVNPNTVPFDLTPSSVIDSVIILDRGVDFATPLFRQMTYEGLIDDQFGIWAQRVDVDFSGPETSQPQALTGSQQKRVLLSDEVELYRRLRDSSIGGVIKTLQEASKRLGQRPPSLDPDSIRNEVLNSDAAKVHTTLTGMLQKVVLSEEFDCVKEFQHVVVRNSKRPAERHNILKDLIARGIPVQKALRLFCLESCIFGGYVESDYNQLRQHILQGYGYHHLLTLANLEKMSLLTTRSDSWSFGFTPTAVSSQTNYKLAQKPLQLLIAGVDPVQPEDISYVLGDTAPLSIRLVQCILQKRYIQALHRRSRGAATTVPSGSTSLHGWMDFEDPTDNVIDEIQNTPKFDHSEVGNEQATRAKQLLSLSSRSNNLDQTPAGSPAAVADSAQSPSEQVILVVFLGGICRAEIAALRHVAEQLRKEGRQRRLMICTTNIITGDTMMDAAIEKEGFYVGDKDRH